MIARGDYRGIYCLYTSNSLIDLSNKVYNNIALRKFDYDGNNLYFSDFRVDGGEPRHRELFASQDCINVVVNSAHIANKYILRTKVYLE